jgi:uncharacterized protein (TIGR02265 family)
VSDLDGYDIIHMLKGSKVKDYPVLCAKLRSNFNFDVENPPNSVNYAIYVAILELIRQNIYPHLVAEKAYEEMGKKAVISFLSDERGRILARTAHIVDEMKWLEIAIQQLNNINQSLHYTLEKVSPKRGKIWVVNLRTPVALGRGLFLGVMSLKNLPNLTVISTTLGSEEAIYEVAWG